MATAFIHNLLSTAGFFPHGHCYLWDPSLIWTMVLTDSLIFVAYTVISISLYVLVKKISLPFSSMFLAFGLFIAACGTTHLMEVYTLWTPAYWFAAIIKVITAAASVATAIGLFQVIPKVVATAKSVKVSEERRMKLEEVNRALKKAKDCAEAANQELEAFSYSVAHDLRAPLRSMMGFGNAVLENLSSDVKPQTRADIEKVIHSAKRMDDLVDGLLNLSNLTRREMRSESVNLSRIANTVVEDLQRNEPERKVNCIISKDLIVTGDIQLLQAMMVNLLGNAWKFTSKRMDAVIEFGKEVHDDTVKYFVRDNGVGFDMRYVGKLFGPFQRLHSVKDFSGNGIGLATVQRIIKRHGGRVWVESKPDQGATFYFII